MIVPLNWTARLVPVGMMRLRTVKKFCAVGLLRKKAVRPLGRKLIGPPVSAVSLVVQLITA